MLNRHMETIIEVKNLVKQYPSVRAVDGVNIRIEKGICFGLLGPNGAGKTTTIEMIEGIISPTEGEVLYKGLPRSENFRIEAGIQFQNTELPQFLTVGETLEFFRTLYPRRARSEDIIAICRLEDILKRDNRKVSGGQKQRLLLAIALVNDPEVVFLDEPTTGLDPQARRHLWEIIAELKAKGRTVILTTHYMEEAEFLCDVIAIMDHGHVITSGNPEKLIREHCGGSTIVLDYCCDPAPFTEMGLSFYIVDNRVEILTSSINEVVSGMVSRGIDLSHMTVRSQNLEDLFLKMTGNELRG